MELIPCNTRNSTTINLITMTTTMLNRLLSFNLRDTEQLKINLYAVDWILGCDCDWLLMMMMLVAVSKFAALRDSNR